MGRRLLTSVPATPPLVPPSTVMVRPLVLAPLLLLLGAAVAANDVEYFGKSENCAKSCPTETAKFSYQDGVVHVFDYYSSVKFLGGDRIPQIGMVSRAQFTVVSKCEMILSLSDVKAADESSPSAEVYAKFSEDLQKNPLRFGFVDGEIVAVCPAKDEPRWALNYKRGVLSTFQNSMQDLASAKDETVQEEDIGGDCSSLYKSEHKGTDIYNVTRIRSPAACVAPPAPPTNKLCSQFLQAMPIIHKEQKCLQTISSGKLKQSTCRENIRFAWNNDDDEAMVATTTSLKHVKEFAADFVVVPTYEASRSGLTIQWEDSYDDEAPADWLSLASELIESLSGFRPTPNHFYQLTELLKLFKYEQLTDLFVKISPEHWKNTAMSMLQVGTGPSLKLIKDNLFSGDSIIGADIFDNKDNRDSFQQIIKLQETSATLVDLLMEMEFDELLQYRLKDYCMKNMSCYDDPSILNKFETLINYHDELDCSMNPPKEVLTTEANNTEKSGWLLKHTMEQNLRNLRFWNDLGYFNKSLISNVTQCINQNHDINVKLAALETIRNVPCNWFNYTDLVVNNNGEDEYSNIMTYLTLSRCPPDNMLEYIQGKLTNGLINQETSFIWSHLSNMDDKFSKSIVDDAQFNLYKTQLSKLSRNIKRVVHSMDKVYFIESNLIFDEQQLIPKYAHMKMQINNTDLLDIEMQEMNATDSSNKPIMSVTIRVRGNTVCKEMLDLSAPDIGVISLYMKILEIGLELFSSISFKLILNFMKEAHPPTFIREDINLYYPTLVGMPFHIKINKTKGTYQKEDEIDQYYTMQKDASLMLDASHTIIGTNMRASIETIPTCNVTSRDDGFTWELTAMYPEEKNTIFEMNIGFNNIENDVLTPRYTNKGKELISDCFSTFSPVFGSMMCYDYTPCPDSWAFSNLKYRVTSKREPSVTGERLVWYTDDVSCGMEYTKMGKSNETYMFEMASFGTFHNFQIATPRMGINGSGIWKKQEYLNISGHYVNEHESSRAEPFSIIGAVTEDKQKNESRFKAVLECTDYYAEVLGLEQTSGDNFTFNIQIPYHPKATGEKNVIEMGFRAQDILQKNRNTSRFEVGAFLNTTEWPEARMEANSYLQDTNDDYDIGAYASASCQDYNMNCSIAGAWYTDSMNIASLTNITGPNNLTVVINKTLSMVDDGYKLTKEMKKNGEICYEMEANAGMTEMGTLYGNMSFEVPLANHSYPLFKMEMSKMFNFMLNKYQLTCDKSYRNHSMGFNFTAGPVGVGDSMEAMMLMSMQENKHYRADLSMTCDAGKMMLLADSKITNSLKDMDLSVEVKTPFKRWYEPEMKLKLLKQGPKVKVSMKTRNNQEEAERTRMEFEALSDYDISTNLLEERK